MRHKSDDSASKRKILLESFKLFASKPFDQVTFADIEKATGLSRGAILYHVQNKENLFGMVVQKLIFEKSTISPAPDVKGLWNNIQLFLDARVKEQKEFEEIGIQNINRAFVNIECDGFYFYKGMNEFAVSWVKNELEKWTALLKNAVKEGEVRGDIDIALEAQIFLNQFMGASYVGIGLPTGYDIKSLKKQLKYLYNKIKAK